MSKRKQLENLATFIGLRAAHEILIKFTNKPESKHHLGQEADTYTDLSLDLAEGNWNNEDIERIKILSLKNCRRKLETYKDIGNKKNEEIENTINNILIDLELKET